MKRDELIRLLKAIPENREVYVKVNDELTLFDRIETVEVVSFRTCDDDGEELSKPHVVNDKPQTTLHFSH